MKHFSNFSLLLFVSIAVFFTNCSKESDGPANPVPPTASYSSISTATVSTQPKGGVFNDGETIQFTLSTTNQDGFKAGKIVALQGNTELQQVKTYTQGTKTINVSVPITTFSAGKRISTVTFEARDNQGTGKKTINQPEFERINPGKVTTTNVTAEF